MEPERIATIADVIAAARPAYDDLAGLAEDVEDEWAYVTELTEAWTARLDEAGGASRTKPAPAGASEAVAALVAEAALVDDPHRAIDWLSTYPQVLLIALGERP